jgi:hypothetical protein
VSNILNGLGIFKSPDQVERERLAAAQGGMLAQQLQDQVNHALYAGNQSLADANGQAQQSGWAGTNGPAGQYDPIGGLVANPFQPEALYFRLRMTKGQLKLKNIEIALVRQVGSAVNVVVITKDQMLTLVDEDVGAFPSDVFIAKFRLML